MFGGNAGENRSGAFTQSYKFGEACGPKRSSASQQTYRFDNVGFPLAVKTDNEIQSGRKSSSLVFEVTEVEGGQGFEVHCNLAMRSRSPSIIGDAHLILLGFTGSQVKLGERPQLLQSTA